MRPDTAIDAKLLEQCENEPIHIPGAIQPFGALLTVERQSLRIQNVSENSTSWFGVSAQELIGCPLNELFSADEHDRMRRYLDSDTLLDQSSLRIKPAGPTANLHEMLELIAHEHLGILFVEVEAVAESTVAESNALPFHRRIQQATNALQRTKGLEELCNATAQEVKELSGFDRVMIYRFDSDWHGVVVAEACNPGVDSYLGLHFPASDIPPQARAIFLDNWLRMIPDVDYLPSRIYPASHPSTGNPLDLGKTLLRSVSPIHLQYLRNMNVRASLTISLIEDGRLWGLIACHHNSPRFVDIETRIAAQVIGKLVSSHLHVKEAEEELEYKAELKQLNCQLIELLEAEDPLALGLQKHCAQLLKIVGAQSCAVYYKKQWIVSEHTPSIAEMARIVEWLAEHMPENGIFHTNSLVRAIPEAIVAPEVASGLLAIQLTKIEKNYVLWFRPEVTTNVTWAGAPSKTVARIEGREVLHPRASFKSWKEVVKSKSLPWKASEIESAEQLRNRLLSIALQQELSNEQKARKLAEKLSLEKEELIMVVAHDLRTPLSVMSMSFQFLQRVNPSEDEVVRRMVERGAYSAQAMSTLITEILDVTKIESGNVVLDLFPESAQSLIEMAVDVFLPLAKEKNVHILLARDATHQLVLCEKNRIMQVFSNLIGNALKFTPPEGKIFVSTEERDDYVVFAVADTGPGISPENLPRIFERFWQAHETKQMGTGLGLWISKSIIEKHGGKIWVNSERGSGAKFSFSLPIQKASDPNSSYPTAASA